MILLIIVNNWSAGTYYYESEGRLFESGRAHYEINKLQPYRLTEKEKHYYVFRRSCAPIPIPSLSAHLKPNLLELEDLTHRRKTHARRFIHARVLLLCDAGPDGPAWNVTDVAAALGVISRMIEHLKKRFVEEGLEAALERKPRDKPPREVIFDGAFEARLITLACSDVPEGHRRWTLRLLADKAVELRFAKSVSYMTVQRVLKKTNLNLISASTGKSRPEGMRPL